MPKEVEYLFKIDINKSNISELEQIKGIGKIIAERIIKYREENGKFNNLNDLLKVKGMSQKTFDKIKTKIKI
ncbi:MAG: helix-hairpin-helix domain-containing protein [Candidatus Firestonebacteria bacterium]